MSVLLNQTSVNGTKSFFAPASGGGGGGGGGTDLILSSIVMNGRSSGDGGAISWAYDFSFNSTGIPAGQVGLQQGSVADSAGNATNAVMVAQNVSGSGFTADFAAGRVIVGPQGTGTGAIPCPTLSDNGGLLVISPGASISSLTVSSINGAAPGGGGAVPADLAVSTLSVNDSVPTNSAQFRIRGADPNLYSFECRDSGGNPVASYTLGTSGGRNQFATDTAQMPLVFTSSLVGATGVISMNPAGTDSLRLGGLGPPGDITVAPSGGGSINLNGTTNAAALNVPAAGTISSLTVSSINGAVYPPAPPATPSTNSEAYSLYYSTPVLNISANTFSTLSTFTRSYSFNDFWTYSGPLSAQLQFNGTGNTNNFTNAAGTANDAVFNRAFVYTAQGGGPEVLIATQKEEGGSLTGNYGPITRNQEITQLMACLLYTSDAADEG
jgi:hypothetical protein